MQQNPRLTQMLVKRLLNRHGIDYSTMELSNEEKAQLREVVSEMQDRVEQFLANEQLSDNNEEGQENN